MRYTVTNDGNVRLQAKQAVKVAGPLGLLGSTADLDDLPELLPGAEHTVEVDVDDVWPLFRLKATVTLAPYASTQDQAGEIPSMAEVEATATDWVLPWSQLVVLVVIAAVIAAGFWWRGRRKVAVQEAIDKAVADALAQGQDNQGSVS